MLGLARNDLSGLSRTLFGSQRACSSFAIWQVGVKTPLITGACWAERSRIQPKMDTISKIRRSANMAAIRSKNTKPEVLVRRFLFKSGLRYRLHWKFLPGSPDIVFPARQVAVFVHGCFWHGCRRCIDGKRRVKSNVGYWSEKIARNRHRDARRITELKKLGWTALTIWECEVGKPRLLMALVRRIKTKKSRRHSVKT